MAEDIPIAIELAKKQRDISIASFFEKNRHLLGFDNPRKSLLTTIKEAVDNSLDACDKANILPEINVEVISHPDFGNIVADQLLVDFKPEVTYAQAKVIIDYIDAQILSYLLETNSYQIEFLSRHSSEDLSRLHDMLNELEVVIVATPNNVDGPLNWKWKDRRRCLTEVF